MVIVGAGASGLAVAATLARRGVRAVALDRDTAVGGTWARRYERLHLHTVRRFSGLPFHPIPRSNPRYVPTAAYADYLRHYAARLELDVRLRVDVRRVSHHDGDEFVITTSSGEIRASAVVIATGRHNVPRLPEWPGGTGFRGRILHSHAYTTGREFAGQRALVIGIGNSGAEIATDLVESGAAAVSIAVRTPPPITAREIAGIPVQLLGMVFKAFPPRFVDWLGAGLRRLGNGDLRAHGLASAAWGPFTARRPPVIDVGFLAQVKAGRIAVRPDVQRLTPEGAVFEDGTTLSVDVVVAATGYTTGLPHFLDIPQVLDQRGYPRRDVSVPGLFFAGFDESPRGQLYESARAAQGMARDVERYLQRESIRE